MKPTRMIFTGRPGHLPGRLHHGSRIHPAGGAGTCRLAQRTGLQGKGAHRLRRSPTSPGRSFSSTPQLRKLIALALDNNRDLRVAALNIERSRAQYQIQRADLFPKLDPKAPPATSSGWPKPFRARESPRISTSTASASASVPMSWIFRPGAQPEGPGP